MTGIGFVLAIVGLVFALHGEVNWSRSSSGIGGLMIVIGGGLMMVGIAIKLWEVMP